MTNLGLCITFSPDFNNSLGTVARHGKCFVDNFFVKLLWLHQTVQGNGWKERCVMNGFLYQQHVDQYRNNISKSNIALCFKRCYKCFFILWFINTYSSRITLQPTTVLHNHVPKHTHFCITITERHNDYRSQNILNFRQNQSHFYIFCPSNHFCKQTVTALT